MLGDLSYRDIQRDAPRDVIVAVIDSGIHMNHPDLINKSVPGWNFIDGNPNLRIHDWDTKSPNASILHGECVASIIAAEVDNGIGIAGAFPRAYIMPIQTNLIHMAEAIQFAVDHKAEVILISGGGGDLLYPINSTDSLFPIDGLYTAENLSILRDIKLALGKAYVANVPIVVGASNRNGRFDFNLLGEDYRTIAVGPHNIFGEVSVHTSFSYTYEIFAPGGSRKELENIQDISSKFPKDLIVYSPSADYDDPICAIGSNQYSFLTLGSAAKPNVAGAIAMIKSYFPEATVEEVREILRKGQVPLSPSGNILEGLTGRISLERIKIEIEKKIQK